MPNTPLPQFNLPVQPEDKVNVPQVASPQQRQTIQEPNHWLNMIGNLRTVTTTPTAAPKSMSEGVLIYMDDVASPTTKRLYVYSREAAAWSYVALT